MTLPSILLCLSDQEASSRLLAELQSSGAPNAVACTGEQLLSSACSGAHVVLDPAAAPAGLPSDAFVVGAVGAVGGGTVLALEAPGLDGDALLDLGVQDVFAPTTSARVLTRRIVERAQAASATETRQNAEENRSVEALTGFNDRVAMRLSRARDREQSVAIFALSVRGLGETEGEVRSLVIKTFEDVLEALDRSEEMSCSTSRVSVAELGDGVVGVLVPDVERVQDAARLAVRIHETLVQAVGAVVHVGISCSPEDGLTAAELIGRARDAVVRARRKGENDVEFYSDSMSRWAFERLTLEQSLRNALRNKELVVYYQPRVDIETRKILGMEALVRWIHPQFGLVSPGQFIPLAEETGLIVPIGEWILRDACRQNAEWRAMGLPKIRVSVNISPLQFRRPDLHETVFQALEDFQLDADGLELEVTESLLMNDPAETATTLGRLQARGIHISIDDFGTGYSSLSYLKRFPINALKIDRSFVTDVTSNPDDAAIATAIILMGHSLKLSVVAEGVETENQLAFLKVLQCNEVQGYLFSPPVPADKAQVMLEHEGGSAGYRFAA